MPFLHQLPQPAGEDVARTPRRAWKVVEAAKCRGSSRAGSAASSGRRSPTPCARPTGLLADPPSASDDSLCRRRHSVSSVLELKRAGGTHDAAQRHLRGDRRGRLHRRAAIARSSRAKASPSSPDGETASFAPKAEIEAEGGRCEARIARRPQRGEAVTAFAEADAHAPLDVCIFNVGANVRFPCWRRPSGSPQGVGDGGRCRLPRRARGGAADAAARAGLDLLHRRDRYDLRGERLCRLRQRWRTCAPVAQSMARELGPRNIHVAHLVI